jgi:lysozyme family protein
MDDVKDCNLGRLLDDLLEREGGYVDHPAYRRGPPRFGITEAVARARLSSRHLQPSR